MGGFREKICWNVFIPLVVSFAVFFGVNYVFGFEKPIPFETYQFEVEIKSSNGIANLNDFQIFYDFDAQQGDLTFRISATNPGETKVIVKVPNSTHIANNSQFVTAERALYDGRRAYTFSARDSVDNKEILQFRITGRMVPNAEFRLVVVGSIAPPASNENGAFFKLSLGNYVCEVQPCFESFHHTETFHYYNNTLRVATNKTASGWEEIHFALFNLNFNKYQPLIYKWRS